MRSFERVSKGEVSFLLMPASTELSGIQQHVPICDLDKFDILLWRTPAVACMARWHSTMMHPRNPQSTLLHHWVVWQGQHRSDQKRINPILL